MASCPRAQSGSAPSLRASSLWHRMPFLCPGCSRSSPEPLTSTPTEGVSLRRRKQAPGAAEGKTATIWWLQTTHNYAFAVLEARSLNPRCARGPCAGPLPALTIGVPGLGLHHCLSHHIIFLPVCRCASSLGLLRGTLVIRPTLIQYDLITTICICKEPILNKVTEFPGGAGKRSSIVTAAAWVTVVV